MAILAAYVIYRVTDSIPGTGKGTQLYRFMEGKVLDFPPWFINKLEAAFHEMRIKERLAFYHFAGAKGYPEHVEWKRLGKALRGLESMFSKLRGEIKLFEKNGSLG